MHQISIDDQLYADVSRRATDAGFASAEDYIIDLLREDVAFGDDELQRFFTPERLAVIDSAVAEIEAGKGVSAEQARAHLERKIVR